MTPELRSEGSVRVNKLGGEKRHSCGRQNNSTQRRLYPNPQEL